MRVSAEIIRETTVTTRRAQDARLRQVEERSRVLRSAWRSSQEGLRQDIAELRRAVQSLANQGRADKPLTRAQHGVATARQRRTDAERMAQPLEQRQGPREE